MTGTVIETDLKSNAGSLEEIVMVALAVLVGHPGDATGTVLAAGGILEMREMKEVTGGAGILGGVESRIETEIGTVRGSVTGIEIVTETGQDVDMTMIAGGQGMMMIEAGMEEEDGEEEEEEEIGPEKKEVGVVVTNGKEGEGIVTVTENAIMIVNKSKTETGMVGEVVEEIATVIVIVTVIKVTAGGVEEIVTGIKTAIEEGGTGIEIKTETEIETVAGEVEIEIETKIEIEEGEIVME